MHTVALSDISINTLHHAYLCISHDKERTGEILQEWWNKNISSEPKVLTYQTFGIDDAHALSNITQYTVGDTQEGIIISAATITREAQNALLKLFEEPVAGLHFFVIVPSFDIVLPTLQSRMQKIAVAVEDTATFDAEKFLKDSPSKRLKTIERLLKKSEEGDEAKSGITRMIADELENALATNQKLRNPKIIEALKTVRNYQNLQGASHKTLLEYLALCL